MIILGMTGPIGHGKSTFANALSALEPDFCHLETSMIITEVANALHAALGVIPDPYDVPSLNQWLSVFPRILHDTLGVESTAEQTRLDADAIQTHPVEYQKLILHVENLQRDPNLAKTEITQKNKDEYRPFLQWLGGYLVEKVSSGVWFDELARRIKQHEEQGCKVCIVGGVRYPHDATTLRAMGAKIIKVYRPGHLQSDMLDPTERERDNIQVDSTIMSNGSVEDLQACAATFLNDARTGQLKPTYHTR